MEAGARRGRMTETAVLVLAHGTPDRLEELGPFVERIRGGRPLGAGVIEEIQERYRKIGGRSPLTDITMAQARGLQDALGGPAKGYRCFVGMKHWHPTIREAALQIAAAGLTRWIVAILAPHTSRLSTGGYREKVEEAAAGLDVPPRIRFVPSWHRHPLFLEAWAGNVRGALSGFPEEERASIPIVITAHSLPERIREWDDPYPREVRETAEGLMGLVGHRPWRIAYQSRGMTGEAWLGPEVEEVLEDLGREGAPGVVIAPVGFVADHVEVLYDIDIDLRGKARGMGIRLERAPSLNDDPRFVRALAAVVLETAASLEDDG
jgi:ferrochelatase